ncbi:hypothetical protein ACUXV3_06165 [Roseobacteraceae bacterium NS-SX3]
MKNRFSSLLAAAVLAAVSPAQAVTAAEPAQKYNCDNATYGFGGWVPRQLQFTLVEQGTKAVVWDAYIKAAKEQPVLVNVKQRKNGQLRFKWRLSLKSSDWQKVPVSYRVDFDPETLKGRMHASVGAFSDTRLGGYLTCQAAPGK